MSGARSRNKGNREELHLVAYLRTLGYEARRIPLSGAMKGFKHDVEAEKDGHKITFENKSRKCTFKGIYELYNNYVVSQLERVVRFDIEVEGKRLLCAFGSDFEQVKGISRYPFCPITKEHPDHKRFLRAAKLNKLRAGADYLVIKDNGRNRLFFRFWE